MSALSAAERAAGLTQPLPANERIVWQAKPDAPALTRNVFHLRGVFIWFAGAAALVFASALRSGLPAGQAVAEATLLVPFACLSAILLGLVGRASARATTYTLTNRRIILHIGVAYEMTVSVPLSSVVDASLRRGPHGTGEIALVVKDSGDTNYIALWPHARPWRFLRPQPMLRGLTDVETVAETIGDALVAFNTAARARPAAPAPVRRFAEPQVLAA